MQLCKLSSFLNSHRNIYIKFFLYPGLSGCLMILSHSLAVMWKWRKKEASKVRPRILRNLQVWSKWSLPRKKVLKVGPAVKIKAMALKSTFDRLQFSGRIPLKNLMDNPRDLRAALKRGNLNLNEVVVDSIFSSEIVIQNITLVSFPIPNFFILQFSV